MDFFVFLVVAQKWPFHRKVNGIIYWMEFCRSALCDYFITVVMIAWRRRHNTIKNQSTCSGGAFDCCSSRHQPNNFPFTYFIVFVLCECGDVTVSKSRRINVKFVFLHLRNGPASRRWWLLLCHHWRRPRPFICDTRVFQRLMQRRCSAMAKSMRCEAQGM